MTAILLATESSIRKTRKPALVNAAAVPVQPAEKKAATELKVFALAKGGPGSSFSQIVQFRPERATVTITTRTRDRSPGWGYVQVTLALADARAEYRRLLADGYQPW